jgi:S-adenosylmethionine/arginine decarboxylase-like enzyme
MHIWDEESPAMMQLDVYTCGPLDPYDVVAAIQEFEPVLVEMKYLDREQNLVEIPMP